MKGKKISGTDAMLKFENNEAKKISLHPHSTILQFKKKLIGKSNLQPKDLLVAINGKQQVDDDKKINQCGFKPNSLISVEVLQSKGPKFSFNGMLESISEEFSDYAPDYRTVFPGLVLEAKCINGNCNAYNDYTLINKGFGTFELAKQIGECECPACGEPTQQAVNMGYYFTKIKIEGKKAKQKSKKVILDEISADNYYHTFMSEEELEQWNFITVISEQLK